MRIRHHEAAASTLNLASIGVFLFRCLMVTAYDEKYVGQLLSNRSVVDNGQSLNGTSLLELRENEEQRDEHSVRCILNIENWTAWRLKDALSHNHCGYIHEKFPAPNVEPATREVMVGHKQGGTATGTCGTVSWQIEHLDTRLIVMWSVPFNYNIHDSYFAVGMIFNRGRFTSSSYWFNQMYYSEKGPYKRGHGGQNITFENSAIVVHATMEPTTYHPVLNISVLPQVRYKLAPLIWKRLYNDPARFTGGANAITLLLGRGSMLPWPSSLTLVVITALGACVHTVMLSRYLSSSDAVR
eukprot:13723.XXX_1026414_1001110_1 [CDS] Oithona nana genome sequencing.